MQNFLDTCETRKRSFISAFTIYMTLLLNIKIENILQRLFCILFFGDSFRWIAILLGWRTVVQKMFFLSEGNFSWQNARFQ